MARWKTRSRENENDVKIRTARRRGTTQSDDDYDDDYADGYEDANPATTT